MSNHMVQIKVTNKLRSQFPRPQKNKPLSIDNIRYCKETQNYDLLTRTKSEQIKYEERVKYIKENWNSVEDYIYCQTDIFGCIHSYDPETQKHIRTSESKERVVISTNLYPYNLQDGLIHLLIWSLDMLTDEEIKNHLKLHFESLEDYVFWINPQANQSVKEITHYHVVGYTSKLRNLNKIGINF